MSVFVTDKLQTLTVYLHKSYIFHRIITILGVCDDSDLLLCTILCGLRIRSSKNHGRLTRWPRRLEEEDGRLRRERTEAASTVSINSR